MNGAYPRQAAFRIYMPRGPFDGPQDIAQHPPAGEARLQTTHRAELVREYVVLENCQLPLMFDVRTRRKFRVGLLHGSNTEDHQKCDQRQQQENEQSNTTQMDNVRDLSGQRRGSLRCQYKPSCGDLGVHEFSYFRANLPGGLILEYVGPGPQIIADCQPQPALLAYLFHGSAAPVHIAG